MELTLDLAKLPWSIPESRLYAFRLDGTVCVGMAEYEVRPRDSCIWRNLSVQIDGHNGLAELRATPAALTWGEEVRLQFTGLHQLTVSNTGSRRSVFRFESSHVPNRVSIELPAGAAVAFEFKPGQLAKWAQLQPNGDFDFGSRQWRNWFDRIPKCTGWAAPAVELCWYALGANLIHLRNPAHADRRVVVPSLLGYVAAWQWDAYFIARGLRHGDLQLAREQIELMLSEPSEDGQLPDVIHDFGRLASFRDLPPAEFADYQRKTGLTADDLAAISITKPPLAAWAAIALDDSSHEWLRSLWPTLLHSHEWWWTTGEKNGMRYPVYEHPFSSGLDDSPVFDQPGPRTSPDLAAYLLMQERLLAELARTIGVEWDEVAANQRSAKLTECLNEMWDSEARLFRSIGRTGFGSSDTALTLLPLLTDVLTDEQKAALVAACTDQDRFGGDYRLPTVARRDPDFSVDRMWRGPIWLNINYLVITAFEKLGRVDAARQLARESIELVSNNGGPFEYYRPDDGGPASSAVPGFSWTAALAIDLAVRYFNEVSD